MLLKRTLVTLCVFYMSGSTDPGNFGLGNEGKSVLVMEEKKSSHMEMISSMLY
jgi:hypothetical protein